jgi:hypothetical protein
MENQEPKVAREVAEQEFDNFTEAMDIDNNVDAMDEEDTSSFNKFKSTIVRAIMRGSLVFNDYGEAVYTPTHKRSPLFEKEVTFHERSGASMMAADGKKKGHDMARMYSVLADMCKVNTKLISGMTGPDLKVCEALFVLLMG